ncbi:AAA domain-containing protein [Mucilaginibacter frigoritolerans]|uniref:AAA domain-containing protein n=1 Tax=Mucilaginibacter frigoritolerans TaxID=652788 RepID=A0A562TK65_9SPHI|nr:AAA family ATPase [Mucilaginibacter frigoritolerans]TWI93921.1 AAA domain-containing protein [Mucilaginibacter frigoritolerans]
MNQYNKPGHYAERPMEIELIRSMSQAPLPAKPGKTPETLPDPPPDPGEAFIIKPAADWLQLGNDQQHDEMLFGEFWHEGELCILFADTNVGKSILAVQIGNSISRGEPMPGFPTKQQPENILYFDFELSTKQFEKRYTSTLHGNYRFAPNFFRVVFNPAANGIHKFASYADYINNALENAIISSRARIIIIDNITCLRSGTDSAASAISLMRNLQALKNKYHLSVLVLAHTPKRNPVKPVSRNDLQGSKMLLNFADSAFAIGESQTINGRRYLKQIKQRSSSQVYGAANVCLCNIIKPYNFLQFEFNGYGTEAHHLMHYTEQYRHNTENCILQLRQQGLSMRQIASETRLSSSTVDRVLKRLAKDYYAGS